MSGGCGRRGELYKNESMCFVSYQTHVTPSMNLLYWHLKNYAKINIDFLTTIAVNIKSFFNECR